MSVTTYTVEEVLGSREWAPADDPSKTTIYWEFKAKETDKRCSIGRKPGNDLKVGDSFEASVKSEKNGTLNLKRENTGGGYGGGGGGKSYEADPKKLRGEAMRSAIHASTGYVSAMAGTDRIPPSFFESFDNYRSMEPMIRWFYELICEAQDKEPGA